MTANWYENKLSLQVLKDKYLHDGETSHVDLIERVGSIFTNKKLGDEVKRLMYEGKFFPAGRSLYGAGSKGKFNATMSNCYIMRSPEDSLNDIYEVNREIATVFKAGGGIGVNLKNLRPCGAKTNNAARTSTGAVSFVELFNTTGEIIGFHGRRGATLVGLNINHPDIEDFINLRKKHDLKAMNLSCLIDDAFMEALENDTDYTLQFYVEATGEIIERQIKAKDLWNKILEMNYDYGDPGVLFIDTIRRMNLQKNNKEFSIDICNPCAEYTGPAYNSCNLGSLDLYKYVKNKFTKDAYFDYKEFSNDAMIAVEALDSILDYGYYMQPLRQNRENISKWRSIGLGFMGFADALIALNIRYGSEESLKFASKVSKYLMVSAMYSSSKLSYNRGVPEGMDKVFPRDIINTEVVKNVTDTTDPDTRVDQELLDAMMTTVTLNGLRNAQLISIAPTGSLSILDDNASSGIEPLYKLVYIRSSHGLEEQGVKFEYFSRVIRDLMEFDKSVTIENIKEKYPAVVEAYDIMPIARVKVQGAIQPNIDNAISSTVNLKHESTIEDIDNVYRLAYKLGLKGITVFRDGCKRANILGSTNKNVTIIEKILDELAELDERKTIKDINHIEVELLEKMGNVIEQKYGEIVAGKDTKPEIIMDSLLPISRKTKDRLLGATYRKRTACVKSLYVTVNRDEDGNIFEVFTNKSIHGCSANIATITRMTSLALRSGVRVDKIIEELKQNTCQACLTLNREHPEYHLSLSCPYAIAEALEEEYKRELDYAMFSTNGQIEEVDYEDDEEEKIIEEIKQKKGLDAITCPKCGEQTFIVEGNCGRCINCGECKCD